MGLISKITAVETAMCPFRKGNGQIYGENAKLNITDMVYRAPAPSKMELVCESGIVANKKPRFNRNRANEPLKLCCPQVDACGKTAK